MYRTLALSAVVVLALACGPAATDGESPPPPPGNGEATEVTIDNLRFSPQSISVSAGETVLWTNDDSVPHTVTFEDGPDSGTLSTGGTFEHTFAEAGTFNYVCTIHPTMRGSVAVE